jgi:hypothetical protein
MRETTYAVRERRGSKAAVVPLGLLAAVFFIPSYRGCADERFQSPAHFASDLGLAAWIVPVFLCAGLLALLTARALRRGEVDRFTRRTGLAAVAAFALSEVAIGVAWTASSASEWPWLATWLGTSATAALLVRGARGLRPWQIWEHLLAGFTVLAAASGPAFFLGGELLRDKCDLGPGGYVFDAALVALAGIAAVAVVRAHLGRQSAPGA